MKTEWQIAKSECEATAARLGGRVLSLGGGWMRADVPKKDAPHNVFGVVAHGWTQLAKRLRDIEVGRSRR